MLAKYAVVLASSLALVSAGANAPVSFPWGYGGSTTTTKCSAATVTATSTTTATKTVTPAPVTVTATATAAAAPVQTTGVSACLDVIAGNDLSGGAYDYTNIYAGKNTISPNNAGVQAGVPSYNYTFAGTLSACEAAYAVANASYQQIFGDTNSSGGYTFNVYFRIATQDWFGIAYYNAAVASDFSVVDANVQESYGYVNEK